jgi:hypothetical protein
MRSATRPSRKTGPPGLVEKRPLYVQVMKEGHSNRAACRILGINPNTGRRWLHGRNGVEGLVQQGLDPRPRTRFLRQVGPAAICQRTNGSSLLTGCWFGRVFNRSLVILGGPRPQSAGSWLGIVPTHVAIIRSAPRKWHRRGGRGQGSPSLPLMTSCGITSWSACRSGGALSRSAGP